MQIKQIYYGGMFILLCISVVLTVTKHPIASYFDWSILIIFTIDTFYHLFKSENKWQYIKQNPLDFISIIPINSGFRFFRFLPLLMQFLRVTTVGKKYILPYLSKLTGTGLGRFLAYFVVVFFVLPLPMYWIEPGIKNYPDLLWWSLQTVTTVGYGDITIVSNISRCIAAILMFLGIGMISTLTSSVTKMMTDSKSIIQDAKELATGKNPIAETAKNTASITIELADLERIEQLIQKEKERLKNNE
ncbi:potassium channel family protein [Kurthia sibirica]|uniref:Potassium channel domain-containing protein n=1 Tax=Kurthia sibirica TaxID=202750 RepID=A0A2U3AMV7_9BACL|nr:potassium channel family protein [Kurthia sibirica]PWI25874.1 hypothetical protein DEX24_06640 [Kurthia sibirica]GEK34314.1 ion transporter [Kurthia sibirica]